MGYTALFTFLLPLLVSSVALQPEKRQRDGLVGFRSVIPSKQKAFKVESIPPISKVEGAKRVKIIYGPYKLRAANDTKKVGNGQSMDRGGTSWQYQVDDDFPKDITILQAKSEVQTTQFKRTSTAEGIYNHHNVFLEMTKKPLEAFGCQQRAPIPALPYSVMAAGATEVGHLDYMPLRGEIKAGYYVSKNRMIVNSIDVINYKDYEQEVYTATELEYVPGHPKDFLDSQQQRVDPAICGGPDGGAIHPPVGVKRFSVNSTDIVMKMDGYILNARGHMHDGGVNIVFKINDKIVCDSKAIYGGEGHSTKGPNGQVWETIAESTSCMDPIPVKSGDRVFMQANYDIELHPSREQGGHSMMGGMKGLSDAAATQDGDAEQMALMITFFAPSPIKST